MSNSATFSYAQAAKGQVAAQSVVDSQASSTQSQAPSITSTQSQDAAPTPSTRAPSVAVSTTSNELDGSQNTRSSSVKPDVFSLHSNDTDSTPVNDKPASPAALPNQGAEKVLSEVVPQSIEKRGRGQTVTSQATDVGDGKKPRKGKKGKAAEKEADHGSEPNRKENVAPKVELSEAPVPKVNPWTQRQEARAAQFGIASPTSSTQSVATNATNLGRINEASNQTSQDRKQKVFENESTEVTAAQSKSFSGGVKPPKKDAEQPRSNGSQTSRRPGARGARLQNGEDRRAFEAPGPVVINTSSWPTPDTAASGPKSQAHSENIEKTEKPEKEEKDESGPSKPRGKEKWLPVPFVHTVNFETPMPGRGSRGGRANGTRGGRDGAGRGNHTPSASAGDRPQENGATPGASSVPQSKRGSIDMSTSRDNRKTQQAQAGAGKTSGEIHSANSKAEVLKQSLPDSENGFTNQHVPVQAVGSNQRPDEVPKSSQVTRDNGMHNTKDYGAQGQNNGNRSVRGGGRGRGGYPPLNGVAHSPPLLSQGYNYSSNAQIRQPNHLYTSGYMPTPYSSAFSGSMAGNSRPRPNSGSNRPQGSNRPPPPRGLVVGGSHYSPQLPPAPEGQFAPYYPDPHHILTVVLSQVEYYFSIDNLCKDTYLRKSMDSQGFVPLSVIASFKRMQEIAQDYQLIRMACQTSHLVEIVVAEDGQDRVRRRENWQTWVLDKSQRHPAAQNDGPTSYQHFHLNPSPIWPQMYGNEATSMVFVPYSHQLNGNNSISPTANGTNGYHPSDSQLSATVPEFSPTGNPGMGAAGQQDLALGNTVSNVPISETAGKKSTVPSFNGEQVERVGFFPNGHEELPTNGINTNGVNGSPETESH
ncbi:hypothetical protein GGR54DRAFT_231730 [Hypoxylon sp. NC1633]|nr:hypothetical protein GGR54DRAFT_231730 [Hypoxylon sp. NC1633]